MRTEIKKIRIKITDEMMTYGYTLLIIYIKIGSTTWCFSLSLFSSFDISATKYSIADFETFSIILDLSTEINMFNNRKMFHS